MTAHVHAETIIELAQDLSKIVQVKVARQPGPWSDVLSEENTIKWLAGLSNNFESRIKPQPKAICWMNVYRDGDVGRRCSEKAGAMESKLGDAIAMLEVRDDGTAHLHKVEA